MTIEGICKGALKMDDTNPFNGMLLRTRPSAAGMPIMQASADAMAARLKLRVSASQCDSGICVNQYSEMSSGGNFTTV